MDSSHVTSPRIYQNSQSWYGPDLAEDTDWIYEFSKSDIKEINHALETAEARGLPTVKLTVMDFPLPTLSRTLTKIRTEVLDGRGFFLLRGLPVEQYSIAQNIIIYWGLGLYLGEAVSQNAKGHAIGHITNLELDYSDPHVRGYQTTARLPYHADWSDLVLLLCLQSAKNGGLSSIVSSTTIWNEMVRERPDLASALARDLYYTRWGEVPENRRPFAKVVPFNDYHGRMIVSYVRAAALKAQNLAGVPKWTDQQIEAMDCVDQLAMSPKLHLDMVFHPGDIQILCNHSILHSRTSFEDWPEMHRRRYLLRLWLACDDGPDLPPFFTEELAGRTSGGRPNGILVPGSSLSALPDPI